MARVICYLQLAMALANHLALGFPSSLALEAALADQLAVGFSSSLALEAGEPDSEPEPFPPRTFDMPPVPFPPGTGLLAAPEPPDHPSGNGLLAYHFDTAQALPLRVVLLSFSGEGYCQRTRRRHSGSGVRLSQLRRR